MSQINASPTVKDDRLSTRAKLMIMGQENMGQYLFRHTNTMLPRKHQNEMSRLLQLFSLDILVVDVFSGGDHAAIAFLTPICDLSRWVPERRETSREYVVQTAVRRPHEEMQVECIARRNLNGQDSWQLGKNRQHRLDEFPRKHLSRVAAFAGSTPSLKGIWDTMALVVIWERLPGDDLAGLIAHIASL